MAEKKYTPPQYPSKNKDAINNEIMKKMREAKEKGNRVEVVSVFNLDNVPSVVPDIKNLGKKNR
jgi:hypothetical protein